MLRLQEQTPIPYLQATLLSAQDKEVLELDEVWSFVTSKAEKVWIWMALFRRTRQVGAWHFGPRDERTCHSLWEKIPPEYKSACCFSDLWHAYSAVLPQNQHRAYPKKEGQTNHIERFNLTLRQRVGRVVRKTLSFSKDLLHHLIHLRHFFVHYNHYCIKRFNTPH